MEDHLNYFKVGVGLYIGTPRTGSLVMKNLRIDVLEKPYYELDVVILWRCMTQNIGALISSKRVLGPIIL